MPTHCITPPELPVPTGESLCLLCARSGETCCKTDPDLTFLSFPLSEPEWRRLAPFAALATLSVPDDGAAFLEDERQAEKAAEALHDLAERKSGTVRGTESGNRAVFSCEATNETSATSDTALPPALEELPDGGDRIRSSEPNHPDFITSMHALFPGQKARIARLFPAGGRHFSLRTRRDGSCAFLGGSGCRLPRAVRPWYCLLFPAWMIEDTLTLFMATDCLISQKARGPAHGVELLDERPAHIRALHARLLHDWGMAPEEPGGAGKPVSG